MVKKFHSVSETFCLAQDLEILFSLLCRKLCPWAGHHLWSLASLFIKQRVQIDLGILF